MSLEPHILGVCISWPEIHLFFAGMDDLKFIRPLRGHNGSITDLKMLNGMPVSCSDDGTIRFWDSSQAMPVVTLESDSRINALEVDDTTGRLTSAGLGLEVW